MLNDNQGTQATDLARVTELRPVKVIAVTGGKGGVGKTNVTANLGLSLAARGRQVLILDADLGLANVDVVLGLQPRFNLSHVLKGECTLEDTIVTGPRGIQIVPAASGVREMVNLSTPEHAGLIQSFSELYRHFDVMLIDTAAGLSESVLTFSHAAHHVLVVVCDEPASMTDAYALIKILSRDYGVTRFQILANQTRSLSEGMDLFGKMSRVCDRFLSVNLQFIGSIPHDEYVRRAIQQQTAVVEAYPSSEAARAFAALAAKADKWALPAGARGHMEFFLERLIHAGPGGAPVEAPGSGAADSLQ